MPIITPEGGGNGGDSSVIPQADPTDATVDDTTYDNTITGSGKLTTLVLPSETAIAAIALEGDAFPRVILISDPADEFLVLGNGTYDPYNDGGPAIGLDSSKGLGIRANGAVIHVGDDGEAVTRIEGSVRAESALDVTGATDAHALLTAHGGLTTAGQVLMVSLPNSDPSVASQLWNDGGTLKVSNG